MIEFDGFMKEPFWVRGPSSSGFTLMRKIYKKLPKYTTMCNARIFYVHKDDTMFRACIHLYDHYHSVKVGDYMYCLKKIDALIKEHFKRIPKYHVVRLSWR